MKRILTAVDLGPSSSSIIQDAVRLARSLGGKIRLLHVVVVSPQVPPPGVFAAPVTFRVLDLVQSAEQDLRGLEHDIPGELRDGISIEIGHPADRVCALAHTYDADIVVVGAHQYGRFARALGTTAARIVNRLDRPVFVVRPLPPDHVQSAEAEPVSVSPI
jgi:nucleotide-binding universal stress UspA family protein